MRQGCLTSARQRCQPLAFEMRVRLGSFADVYCVEPDALRAIVGSKSDAAVQAAAEEAHDEDIAAALRRIVDGI